MGESLLQGRFDEVLSHSKFSPLWTKVQNSAKSLIDLQAVLNDLSEDEVESDDLLVLAVSALQTFVQRNWTGLDRPETVKCQWEQVGHIMIINFKLNILIIDSFYN